LAELHRFIVAIDGDLSAMLRALPEAVARHAPFADEAAMVEVVRRETLIMLHTLALRALPARGSA
jgi:hypothetical protein